MMKVKINKEGFLESIYIYDATIEVEVNDELYETLMCCKIGKNWRQINGVFHMVDLLNDQVIRETTINSNYYRDKCGKSSISNLR